MLKMMQTLPKDAAYTKVSSPVGNLWMIASKKGLHAVLWDKDLKDKECKKVFSQLTKNSQHSVLKAASSQLKEYFQGKRKKFDLPLNIDGTSFQKRAWKQLTKIPYGKTLSYQEQAKKVGDLKKARAVGSANSKNPISIIVPCHRVISKSGDLSGFGGGVEKKKFLIELESRMKNDVPSL